MASVRRACRPSQDRRTNIRSFDQKHTEVALISMRARQLVLEHRAHEPLVEETRGAINDVQRFGLRVVGSDSTRGTEDRAARKWRAASLAGDRLRPPPEEVANRHPVKPISHACETRSRTSSGTHARRNQS